MHDILRLLQITMAIEDLRKRNCIRSGAINSIHTAAGSRHRAIAGLKPAQIEWPNALKHTRLGNLHPYVFPFHGSVCAHLQWKQRGELLCGMEQQCSAAGGDKTLQTL